MSISLTYIRGSSFIIKHSSYLEVDVKVSDIKTELYIKAHYNFSMTAGLKYDAESV